MALFWINYKVTNFSLVLVLKYRNSVSDSLAISYLLILTILRDEAIRNSCLYTNANRIIWWVQSFTISRVIEVLREITMKTEVILCAWLYCCCNGQVHLFRSFINRLVIVGNLSIGKFLAYRLFGISSRLR